MFHFITVFRNNCNNLRGIVDVKNDLSESLEVVSHYITVSILQLVSQWGLYGHMSDPAL